MIRRPPRSTRTDTLFPYTTLFRSRACRRVHLRFGQANRPYRAPKPHPTFSAPYLAERRSHASLPTLARDFRIGEQRRSEEHTSELQSLMRISYAVFCLKKKKIMIKNTRIVEIIYIHNTHSISLIK